MIKILFLIHDLSHGGAEKVLVNLVNNMDRSQFDITVMTLFDVGTNRQFLKPYITYKYCFKNLFPANSQIMKLINPKILHNIFIKEKYDIEIAYLEGPCSRIISGNRDLSTKLISWIHIEQHTKKKVARSFRSYFEARECYNRFDKVICVSNGVKEDFSNLMNLNVSMEVLYNTNETEQISSMAEEPIAEPRVQESSLKIIGVGKLLKNKGFDRLARVVKRLIDERYDIQLFILGIGPLRQDLDEYIRRNHLEKNIILLGYDTNPYKYVSKMDLFVCSSYAEGFSTAATEALIVGIPVLTTAVSGMKEMLGENNEYGIIVENSEEGLYQGIKALLDNPEQLQYYRDKAKERGKVFNRENTVKAVEDMLILLKNT